MSRSPASPRPRFLVDLGSPYAYLAAERIDEVLGDADWQVVLLGGIFRATGRDSWANGPAREDGRAEVERRALQRGLPPVRWPEPWPSDGLLAARVATWASVQGRAGAERSTATAHGHSTATTPVPSPAASADDAPAALGTRDGAGRAFITQALRLHFAEGRTLSDPANVAEVARRAGLEPSAALAGAATTEVKDALRARTDAAVAAGVYGVPAVLVDQFVVWGDDQLEQAATLIAHRHAKRSAAPHDPTAPAPSAGPPLTSNETHR